MRTSSAILLLLTLLGCSAAPSAEDQAGSGAAVTASTSSALMGTWDIALVSNGDQASSVMKISAKSISFQLDGSTMTANIGGDFIASSSDGVSADIPISHIAKKLDAGIFPYALGGTWTFNDGHDDSCTANVADGQWAVNCTGLGDPLAPVFGPDGNSGTTTFTRTSTLASKFGALGGKWRLAGPQYGCDVTFEGAKLDAVCASNDSPAATSTVSITFGDGIASGTIDGAELSAHQR